MDQLTTYAHHMERLLKVLVYIEEHLDEELPLEKIAKMANISPFYFHRLFHAYMGETLAEYVKRLRIQRAQELLQYSDNAIIEIALDLGYDSPSAFTKVFQQLIGQSPREYRKTMQHLMQAIMKRTIPNLKDKSAFLKPEYINRKAEAVLFVRRVGDYNDTPTIAFSVLVQFLKDKGIAHDKIKTYYSIGLDDPHAVERSKCRFDACVALNDPVPPEGEIGQKILPEGRCAVFSYQGPYCGIEKAFDDIFRLWYPTFQGELADSSQFCEHINLEDDAILAHERITKLYIPLK